MFQSRQEYNQWLKNKVGEFECMNCWTPFKKHTLEEIEQNKCKQLDKKREQNKIKENEIKETQDTIWIKVEDLRARVNELENIHKDKGDIESEDSPPCKVVNCSSGLECNNCEKCFDCCDCDKESD